MIQNYCCEDVFTGAARHMDQAAPAHRALHFSVTSRQDSGQLPVWHPEKTTRPSTKVLGGAGHHEHRALSSDAWSVATDRSAWRALRERERERERATCP